MHKRILISLPLLFIYVTIFILYSPPQASYGEAQLIFEKHDDPASTNIYDDETLQLLQSSLSLVEIDKEISRLEGRLTELEQQLELIDVQLTEQELIVLEKKEAAGKVLRSYFMGERSDVLLSILSSRSLDSFLRKLEFYELIMQHDKHVMNSYKEQYDLLELQYGSYLAEQINVEQVKLALEEQRKEVAALEQEIDDKLANRDDSEKLLLLMEELTNQWKNDGIEKVEHYLYLLNDAMAKFPSWLQKQSDYTKIKGLTYNVHLPEDALNTFLREQHDAFNLFSFSFEDNQIIARGKDEETEIQLIGQYDIVDEPNHYIQFTIDSLYYNKLKLPQSTINEMMTKYDLNFYPSLILSFLQATEVKLSDGYLTLQLKLKL